MEVAKDCSEDYTTITDAVIEAPHWAREEEKWVILVREGVYIENVEVRREKINIMMIAEGMEKIVIIGSMNVLDEFSTFNSLTLQHYDTLYAHSVHQFYRDCHIYGTIDFIFGNAVAVF
ncbi:probable pectinesterase/pectinesterase inhibitor 32 [Amborella trichopoda]|uniref:probable pectinesterase/pectinesterase inhibitor 32 n=1 Tax=Amborella trichopoda TaxID=13333 RepID=UPI0005D3E9DA|nr:probable pectinesterase/pectinesterase inhibitor 32 [Amborella trichopoda]|eukprot:XP_011622869.1 probable pectinesterase/pectinesterase inhibitor 32 [Amborella trichopoda]